MADDDGRVPWLRVEPRRLYRATTGGWQYDLGYRGRGAALDPGWYLITQAHGGVFLHRRLQEAANLAAAEIRTRGEAAATSPAP
jgi:hypothetical protein